MLAGMGFATSVRVGARASSGYGRRDPGQRDGAAAAEAAAEGDEAFIAFEHEVSQRQRPDEQWLGLRAQLRSMRLHAVEGASATHAELSVDDASVDLGICISLDVTPEAPHKIAGLLLQLAKRPADSSSAAAARAGRAGGGDAGADGGRDEGRTFSGGADRPRRPAGACRRLWPGRPRGQDPCHRQPIPLRLHGQDVHRGFDHAAGPGRQARPHRAHRPLPAGLSEPRHRRPCHGQQPAHPHRRHGRHLRRRNSSLTASSQRPPPTTSLSTAPGPPLFAPGARDEYSNYGFMLLGRIVETVAAVATTTTSPPTSSSPRGMTATGNQPETVRLPKRATGYMTGRQAGSALPTPSPGAARRPAAAIPPWATSARFADALMANRLLDAEHTRLLTNGGFTGADGKFWRYDFGAPAGDGRRYYGHNGGAPGMNGELRIFPAEPGHEPTPRRPRQPRPADRHRHGQLHHRPAALAPPREAPTHPRRQAATPLPGREGDGHERSGGGRRTPPRWSAWARSSGSR